MRSLLAVVTALGTLLLTPPSYAEPPGPSDPSQVHPEWGSTTGHDARVRKGCHRYFYDYAITPPAGYWSLETFLIGPGDQRYGSGYFLIGADPTAGQGAFRLCRRATRAGRYTIRARVTVGDDFTGYADGWLPDSTFRLRKHR